jgi:hypothetical protein
MSRFLQYINEGRTKGISENKAISFIKNNCLKNFKMLTLSPKKIYRGVKFEPDYGIIDSNKSKPRKSAISLNYMTLLMDNLPSWKNFPLRSKSVICTTYLKQADGYGNLYIVIPFDNAKVGICPEIDIWESFDFLTDLSMDIYTFTNNVLKMALSKYHLDKNDDDYNIFKKSLIELQKKYKNDNHKRDELDVFLDNDDVIKKLNDLMNPLTNKFMNGIDKFKNIKDDSEIFIQGKCVLISINDKNPQDIYDFIWEKIFK